MKQEFLLAAAALLVGMLPLAIVAMRARPIDGLVALELGGTMTVLALVCIAVGTQSSSTTGVALILAILAWVSGLLCARFLGRAP